MIVLRTSQFCYEDKNMDYKKMYFHLFNAITDALGDMENGDPSAARYRLIRAQQETEEMYINADDKLVELFLV